MVDTVDPVKKFIDDNGKTAFAKFEEYVRGTSDDRGTIAAGAADLKIGRVRIETPPVATNEFEKAVKESDGRVVLFNYTEYADPKSPAVSPQLNALIEGMRQKGMHTNIDPNHPDPQDANNVNGPIGVVMMVPRKEFQSFVEQENARPAPSKAPDQPHAASPGAAAKPETAAPTPPATHNPRDFHADPGALDRAKQMAPEQSANINRFKELLGAPHHVPAGEGPSPPLAIPPELQRRLNEISRSPQQRTPLR